ncbi:sensor histidine kinase [Paenibacillus sp. IB182496]|uniref:Sensor histidine kinase n=1 Tax=Paenibacillus sabuli TaxID=2772509 RepID=A0A927BPZ0_9BACL|nr:sensor histidine kinase [Paenibacillus sabuli]MBD2843801.1 sensor histidine kinase [Paenibacillus sabuli]
MARWSVWNDIRTYKFNSVLVRYFVMTVLLLMVPIGLVQLAVYKYNDEMLKDEITRSNLTELVRVLDAIDNTLLGLANVSFQMASYSDYASVMGEDFRYPLSPALIDKIHSIQASMNMVQLTNANFSAISLYVENSDFVITGASGGQRGKFDNAWWIDAYRKKQTQERAWIEFLQSVSGTAGAAPDTLAHFRQLPVYSADRRGVLFISIDMSRLQELLGVDDRTQQLFILDADGRIVYGPDSGQLSRRFADLYPEAAADIGDGSLSRLVRLGETDLVLSAAPSAYQDWRYVSLVPLQHYYPKQVKFKQFMTYLVLLAVVSSLLFAMILSLQSYRPISGILSMLHPGDKAELRRRPAKFNEVNVISAALANSNEKRKAMELELQRRYELLQKSQSIALQAQIKPHFLYNTLESINLRAMRLTKGKNEVSEMIQTLSRLLRLSLMTEDDMIPLRTELEHARLYVQMQQMRRQGRLEVTWLVNESILDCAVIKLTLQPILENAIVHGIQPSRRPGAISVIGYAERESIVLKIKDNGVGMARAVADRLNQSFLQSPIKENEHIGLRNVNQRIKLVFGSAYGLRIASKEGEGALVELRIPKRPGR